MADVADHWQRIARAINKFDPRKVPWQDRELRRAQHVHAVAAIMIRTGEVDCDEVYDYMREHSTGIGVILDAEVFLMGYFYALWEREQL